MGIATSIIQTILISEVLIFTLLLLPLPRKNSILNTLSKNIIFKGLKHILLAIYTMISILFFDSGFKLYKGSDNIYFVYHAERDFYLTSFTLFLALVLNTFVKMLLKINFEELNANCLKKQALNQKDFVAQIIEQSRSKDTKIEELEVKIQRNEMLLKQLKNNNDEYFVLLDKYNSLMNKLTGENKKSV